jgi:hypothetical protein
MSDLSLLTGIYANVEHFASLIDTVIEHMLTNLTARPGMHRGGSDNCLSKLATKGRHLGRMTP